ncbi:MAG: RraA family protein [Caldilineales bacterium]|nr:RraA family protein [Caldilineales bacterium]
MLSPAILSKLASFDTPTICNVIELFEVRPRSAGYMDARIKAAFPDLPPIVGYAATATFRSAEQVPNRQGYGDIAQQVERFAELDGPAIVVFQDLNDPPAAAAFGEVMCSTYHGFGAKGLVSNGAGRDLDQVRALGFSVFTGGTICSHGYHQIPDIHVPVRVGGVTVFPNDLLHADVNGVTTIPKEIAAEVADICPEFIALEAIIIDTVRSGSASVAELRRAMAESSAVKAELRQRVTRSR